MTEFTGAWAEPTVESFLEETTVPVRLACHRPDGKLWLVALWFRYRDGAFECATGAGADLVRYLRHDPAVAFDVSVNRPPYRGVRGSGTATLTADADKGVLRALVERYLGDTESDLAAWLLSEERSEVRIRIEPDRFHSWDYSDRMGAVSREE
jgi:nitroimidazol reductase NimA-like FMN-containing flavoprotein (pyridoxamine 5'-phosphate oxidase superfamily)